MLDGLVPELAPRLLIAIGGVGVALLVLVVVLIFLKRRNSPLFVKGGRAREPRLLVMDAAAVDAKRRLVLIRRDDTEHLIMIGGPTDIVIESGIGGHRREAALATPATADRSVAIEQANRPGAGRPEAAVRSVQAEPRPEKVAAQPAAVPVQGRRAAGDDFANHLEKAATEDATAETVPTAAEDILDAARARVIPAATASPARDEDAIRALEARLEASKAEAAKQEAARAEAARLEAARQQAAKAEAERIEVARRQAERVEAERREAERAEAARREAQRLEASRREAERVEAERLKAEQLEAERREIARQQAEAERREAERLAAEQAQAARQEALRQQAEREEQALAEAARLAAERAEAVRAQAEKAEAERIEAARLEAERIAAARAEAMARFEAARRAQAQRSEPQIPTAYAAAEALAPEDGETDVDVPVLPEVRAETEESDNAARQAQQRLASDFEKLLEAELEAGGIIDSRPIPVVTAERREAGYQTPAVQPVQRDTQPITGAVSGHSAEQEMARRLGEISLGRKIEPTSNT